MSFLFRSHDPGGSARNTAELLVDALSRDRYLSSLADSVHTTISQETGECRLVLAVEQEPPVQVDFAPVGEQVAAAYLRRGPTGAVVVMVSATHSRLAGPDIKKLERGLEQAYPDVRFGPMFQWVMQTRPPLATAIYLQPGEPDTGVDTVAVCVAGAYFPMQRQT